jgi:hypothetical protein
MNLRHDIKRILREESNKDLTQVIQTLLDDFVDDHKNVLCKAEVKHPDKRTKLPHSDNVYENYRATFYLIGGYKSDNWLATLSVRRAFDDLMNEAWDLVYNYTGKPLDMFTKYVDNCDDIIQENKDSSIPNMIKTFGVSDVIKYSGNYYTIEPYLKVVDKVNFIKEKVRELSDDEELFGIGLHEINEEPLHYSDEDGEEHQIEWLGLTSVDVSVYEDEYSGHLRDYYVKYESLPVQIIEELVEILLNH